MIRNLTLLCTVCFVLLAHFKSEAQAPSPFDLNPLEDSSESMQEMLEAYNGETFEVAQRRQRRGRSRTSGNDLVNALRLAKKKNYKDASIALFRLSHSPRYRSRKLQIKYILGLMLFQMRLNQVAAFQFIQVVKEGRSSYLQRAIEKLSLAADALGDDTLLNYAISRVEVRQFPRVHRDMLYYRIGEFQYRNRQYQSAAKSFARVGSESDIYSSAKYQQGLSYAQAKKPKAAMRAFEQLIDQRSDKGITDEARVAGLAGRARVAYQAKQWGLAIDYYRDVPRDTELWHNTLFESSWAMLRSGKFRSALSNFHSLHSAYYEDFYLPESLLLRSIVYLYICKYTEMQKVLNLFNRIYKPVFVTIDDLLDARPKPATYFNEVIKALIQFKRDGKVEDKSQLKIPFLVIRRILQEGDFQNSYNYIKKLLEERRRIKSMPADWQRSAMGRYSRRVMRTRLTKARERAGRQIRAHLEGVKNELFDLFEEEGFIRYEMINGRKELLKKKISEKELPEEQVNEDTDRDYYIQNGYEYWPFRGEYWLDELGNYHYVGTQACR